MQRTSCCLLEFINMFLLTFIVPCSIASCASEDGVTGCDRLVCLKQRMLTVAYI